MTLVLPSDFDDQAADGVDIGMVAGIEHRRCRDLFDDRWSLDLVAGEERLAPPHLAFEPIATARHRCLEKSPAAAASSFGWRLAPAARRARQFGRVDQPGRGHREA